MNVRSIRGPNCCEASVRVTIMTEKTTPTTVMSAPASAARISLAASGDPLITQEGRLSWRWKAAWSMLSVSTKSRTTATLSTAGISHRFVRRVSLRQSDSTANRLRPIPISAHDPLADRAEDQHREVDEAADDHDHADQEGGEGEAGGVQGRPGPRVRPRPRQRAGDREGQHDRREPADQHREAER